MPKYRVTCYFMETRELVVEASSPTAAREQGEYDICAERGGDDEPYHVQVEEVKE